MTARVMPSAAGAGVRGFVSRHPYLSFLLVFNTLGQALAFAPVVARRWYGVELDTELVLIVAALLFLLAPALVIARIARGRARLVPLTTVPVGALLGWAHTRTGSLALAGLIRAAPEAAGLSLVAHLWHQPGGGGLALLVLGLLVMAVTRGRLGWTAFRPHDPGAPAAGAETPRTAAVAGPARPIRKD